MAVSARGTRLCQDRRTHFGDGVGPWGGCATSGRLRGTRGGAGVSIGEGRVVSCGQDKEVRVGAWKRAVRACVEGAHGRRARGVSASPDGEAGGVMQLRQDVEGAGSHDGAGGEHVGGAHGQGVWGWRWRGTGDSGIMLVGHAGAGIGCGDGAGSGQADHAAVSAGSKAFY